MSEKRSEGQGAAGRSGDGRKERSVTVIICVEERGGMLFNGKRLQDVAALHGACGGELWMNEYSDELFSRYGVSGQICDADFLSKAGADDLCFVEDCDLRPYRDKITCIVRYCWNRRYPADLRFDEALLEGFSLIETREFPGSSHEKITREVYR